MKGACVAIVIGAYLSCAAGQNQCPNDLASFPVVENCSQYYDCSTEYPILSTCTGGLYYHCMNQDCEASPFTDCCYLDPSNPVSTYTCNDNMVSQKDPRVPRNYYMCIGSETIVGSCNPDEYFNNITHSCQVLTSTSTASTTASTTVSTTASTTASVTTTTRATSTLPSTSYPGVPHSSCGAEGTKIGNVINSNLYYECQNGVPVAMKCPLWQKYFNCWTNTCSHQSVPYCCNSGLPPFVSYTCSTNGMLIADPKSCNNYYKCIDMKVVKQACTNGYVFDVWKKKCLSPMEAKCAISPKATACSAKVIGLLPVGILSVSSSLLCPPVRY